jgi:hypothetical protein
MAPSVHEQQGPPLFYVDDQTVEIHVPKAVNARQRPIPRGRNKIKGD